MLPRLTTSSSSSRMFKLHRHRSSDRVGERFDFRFSNFRAVQVPAVSDRLFLSIVSVDSGRTIAKSSKVASRSGICQWPDTILEPIWFSKDEVSKEFEDCQYKIIVSLGSTKSGILGEIFLNLSNFLNIVDPTAISLPLKRCNAGTVLQLKVQCLGTKSKLSGVRSLRDMAPRLDDRSPTPTNDEMDNKSDCSDGMINRSVRSSSENHLVGTYQDESGNRETSFSAPGSHRSSNSGDSTADRTNFSPRDNSSGGLYVGRQDSASSYASYVSAGRGDDGLRSNNSSFSSRASGPNLLQGNTPKIFSNGLSQLSMGASDSSKDLLEAAEETIEELRDEAKMWERHSRKLKADLEMLKKECSEKSKQHAELAGELSAAQAERDSYRHEIEELKSSLQDVNTRQTITGTPKRSDWIDLQKELEGEVKFLRESNADLTIQLNRTQESNIELLSILQELEETIEEQRVEISKISKVKQTADPENGLLVKEDKEWAKKLSMKEDEITVLREKLDRALNIGNADGAGSNAIYLELEKENEILRAKIQELEKDCSELTDENLELIYKLKENGLTKGQVPRISNNNELQFEKLTSRIRQLEEELRNKEMLRDDSFSESSTSNADELQRKCADLELKLLNFRSQTCELEEKFQKSQEELEQRNLELSVLRRKLNDLHSTELEVFESGATWKYQSRTADLEDTEPEIDTLKARFELQLQENDDLRSSKVEMENFISEIQAEKSQLEERLSASLKESSITSKCLDEVRKDILVLSSSIDSHVSANKVLERNIIELESCKAELELHVSELEQENIELSERISGLEAQLTYLTNEKESSELQIHDSRSLVINLKDKVERQQSEMETQRLEFKQKQQESQRRLSETQDDSEEHMEQEERINRAHFMLNKIEKEKTLEVENLKREVVSLTAQVSSTHEERESATLDAIREVSVLRADKAKLEANLQDVSTQLRHYESQLEDLRKESKNKIKGLVDSLNASKQSEEMLTSDAEHMKKLMEAARSNEDALRKTSNELELKLKSSDYEKQQMLEEISGLKLQVQKIMNLQDEVFKLQSSLDEAKFGKGKLEEILRSVTEECEELKAQKAMLTDKVSDMQETLRNGEEEKRNRIAMQAKLVRLESDLSASEASHVHEAELKNELSRIKRSNSEYQRKIQSLEQENEDLTRRVQTMEKGFEQMSHVKENLGKQEIGGDNQAAIQSKIELLETKLAEALEENKMYRAQQKSPMPEGQPAGGDGKEGNTDRILQLEGELRDMKERLLNMSLQYAEVEAQRERLVMELKAMKKGRWF
ncbi:hypothetical protein Zm00014a_042127 [Zea mays]|uniref:C2 NT-type domain-containing protein n=3 Tax=Zea mays TaxID=4577 RepID=A0A317YAV1_MAIZE|nr:hypothetical protein Zm00014a_042127 [Zea mays]PWZ55798.1 hypothetical protein Zm00014a_042127 [Zea mays]PWZ55799.1 hypothetical protein Zm00014a_042127 [Zea mays]